MVTANDTISWGYLGQNQEGWEGLLVIPPTSLLKQWKQALTCHTQWVPGTISTSQFNYLWATGTLHFQSPPWSNLECSMTHQCCWWKLTPNTEVLLTMAVMTKTRNSHCALTKGLPCAVSALSITSFNYHSNATKDSWLLLPFQTGGTDSSLKRLGSLWKLTKKIRSQAQAQFMAMLTLTL